MRLAILEHGHALRFKLKLGAIRLLSGGPAPDVARTLFHRPKFFGGAFGSVTHAALRESEHWSVGECELLAAFVSRQNECKF